MSMESIASIKAPKFIKPQRLWRWEIAIYLYLAGMGAGSYIIGMVVNWLVNPTLPKTVSGFHLDLAKPALLWGPLFVAVGAPFLILDLGIKRRFLFACLNPTTSWVARGFLILSAFIVLGLTVFGISFLCPQWLTDRPGPWFLLEIVSVLFAFATALYTGILLKSVKYVPVWNTPLLPVLFLASALSTGSMGIILAMMGSGLLFTQAEALILLAHKIVQPERILIVIEGLILALYLYSRYRAKDQGETSVRLLLSGKLKPLFWIGIVLIGFVFPFTLEYTYSCCPDYPELLYTTGIFLLCGGFFLRLGVLASGVKEQPPMHKLVEIKANLRGFKKDL
jgi:formate-dependent nitrite reductase membrane component NrfD